MPAPDAAAGALLSDLDAKALAAGDCAIGRTTSVAANTGFSLPTGGNRLVWRVLPLLGLAAALGMRAGAGNDALPHAADASLPALGLILLMAVVFSAAYHADVIAHRIGEPYGTLVLTLAVTVIEVALILSIMLAGTGNPTLARETVFSAIMVVCNGVAGLCLILGGLRYGEQGFRLPGATPISSC